MSAFASPVEAPRFSPTSAYGGWGEDPRPTILTPDALARIATLVEHGRSAVEIRVSGEAFVLRVHWGLAPFSRIWFSPRGYSSPQPLLSIHFL
jgi:hypothetical protein